jgi:hypothetical protein
MSYSTLAHIRLPSLPVSLREFQGAEDTAELFADEKEAAQAAKVQEERERAINVPGMLKVRLPFTLCGD